MLGYMPTESQLRDGELRARIRQRIDDGRLPVMLPRRINAGYGSGHTCRACDQPITRDEVEYEVDDYRDGRPLSFHLGCHVIWQLECVQKTKQQRPEGPAAPAGNPADDPPPQGDGSGNMTRWWDANRLVLALRFLNLIESDPPLPSEPAEPTTAPG
jgi:hypothetical protein